MKMFWAIMAFVCSAQLYLPIAAYAVSWPLYPWISSSHEINQGYDCQQYIGGVLYRHGGERCGSQMYKTGFVMSQIGLFGARGGAHDGIDIVTDNWTNVVSVDWLDVDKRDIVTGVSDIVVSVNSACAEGDSDGAGIRYRNLSDWWGDYKYNYWHLNCVSYSVYSWWLSAEQEDIYPLYPGRDMGTVGETGNADAPETPNGPHLHFGVMENNAWINPLPLLDDWAPPELKFNYVVSNFGAADARVFSWHNSQIGSLSSLNPVYAKTFVKFGIETSDDAIVKKARFDLLDSYYTLLAIKEFNLNPDSRVTNNSTQFSYFPEWKGVVLRSSATGGSQAVPNPNSESVADPWNYDINPDALMSFTVGSEPNTINLAQGRYTLRVTAEDFKSNIRSDEIALVLDRIPPTGSISLAAWDGVLVQPGYTNSEIIRVSLLGLSDAVSGVDAVRLSNDGIFDTEFFQAINPLGVVWTLLSGDGQKTVYAQFRDRAGNISGTVSAQIWLDTGGPAADMPAAEGGGFRPQGVGDTEAGPGPGLQYISVSQFNFTWDPNIFSDPNGIAGYSITIKNLTNNTVHQQGAAIMPSFTATGLLQGNAYYAQVQARDPAGNLSLQIGTGRVIIDTTPPLISAIDDGDFTNQTFQLAASWQASDPESGIQEILYSIGTTPGGGDIKGFTSVGTQLNATAYMGTTLEEGVYYWTIKALNQAGLTAQLIGDGVVVDITPPPTPVNLLAEGLNPSSWKNAKEYNLSWTEPSDVSGIAGARVKFGGATPVSNNEGVFFLGQNSIVYPAMEAVNGQNAIWVWLEDNAGNANPATAVPLTLRYDDIKPVSIANASALSKESIVPVSFDSIDEGAPDTGSGVNKTVLWYRNNGGEWTTGGYISTEVNGTFDFATQGTDGLREFYTQAFDNAGNMEPAPNPATPAKAQTFVDLTAPVITITKASAFSPDSAVIEWTTDDETTAVIDYGRTTSLGSQFVEATVGKTHSITITGLPNPADIYFKITATNKTGLTAASAVNSFKTPLNISYDTDIFGVIDYTKPVTLYITNPDINSATFVVDGQTGTVPVNTSEPVLIYVDPAVTGGGSQVINVRADGYEYTSSFVVDNAVRTVKLARLVISAGGLMSELQVGQSAVDATVGQAAQEEMQSDGSKLYLGYYAGIDPVAPGVIGDLSGHAGPEAGQIALEWTAPGDDNNIGTAMKYELRYSPEPITPENFNSAVLAANVPLPQKAGTQQQAVVSDLSDGKTYYFAAKVVDELLNYSLSAIASAKTLEVAKSAALINGQPVVEVISAVPAVSIVQVPPDSSEPAVVIAREAVDGQGLVFYSDIFEIGPPMSLPEGAIIYFRYADPGAEIEPGLGVYKFDPAQSKWVSVASVVNAGDNVIRAVTYSFSLYAVFGRDKTPPVTVAELSGGIRYTDLAGNIFVSSATKAALSPTDPGVSGGIARIEYRLDSSTGPFETYAAPLWLGEGWHSLQFRSVDKAGNTEPAKSLFVMKDILEPRVEITFDREFVRLPGGIIHVSSISANLDILTLDQPSSGSGLKKARFELDGAVSDIPPRHSVQLDLGRHSIRVWAEDNVGNITELKAEVVVGDLLPPVITAPANNFAAAGSTITFSWQHQTTTFFSLTEYDLMLGAEPGFENPLFTHIVSSKTAVSLSFNEAGVSIDGLELHVGALRLVTEHIPDYIEGTLEGIMTTSPIGLPALTTGISGFAASQTSNNGSVIHEYSLDGVNYYAVPADGNIGLNLPAGGSIRFRSKLSRAALADASPMLAGIQFTVNYQVAQYDANCHYYRVLGGVLYHCHDGYYYYTDYNYSNTLPAADPQNTLAGLRAAGSAVELITDHIPDQSTGTLSGTWLSPFYEVPEQAYRIGDFIPDYDSNGGGIFFEFSKSSASFRPIAELPSLNVKSGDSIRFKALINRNSPADISPAFRGISFNFLLPPPTGTIFTLPEEGRFYWRVAAKDYMGRFSAPSEERLIVYDAKPPVTDLLLEGTTGQNGWYIMPVSVAFISTDAVAGVKGTYYSVDGSSFALYSPPFALTAEGARVLKYYSIDASGNKEAETTFAVKIDLSSPTVLSSVSPAPNRDGWNNAPVAILFTGSDTVSGIAYCSSSAAVSGEGAGQTVTGYCADYAGFMASATVTVNLDLTAPQVYISSPASVGKYVATRDMIGVAFAFTDNLDAKPFVSAKLVQTENKGLIRGATELAVLNGDTVEPLDIDDGLWRLEVYARDHADNSTTAVSGVFEVVHDVLPPDTALEVAGDRYQVAGGELYVTARTTFTLTSADDLITSGDGAGLGVKRQRIKVRGQGSEVRELAFENPEPKQGQTFISVFTLAGMADGVYGLEYKAEDIIGNIEEVKISTYAVDNTAPQTGYKVAGVGYRKDGTLYIPTESGIYLETMDPVSNGVASGLKAVYLSVDGQPFAVYGSTFTLNEGIHQIAFYGEDNAGNAEPQKSVTVMVDATPPITSLVPGGNYYIPQSGQHAGDFYAPAWLAYKLSAYDPVSKDVSSGLAVSEYRVLALDNFDTEPKDPSPQDLNKPFTLFNYDTPNNSFALAEGIQRVDYRSRDNVLNLELAKTTTVFVDATPPVSVLQVSPQACCGRSDGLIVNSTSPLTVYAEDPVINGVASGSRWSYFVENGAKIVTRDYLNDNTVHYYAPASNADGPINLTVFSIDNVGNNETPFNARVVLDNTPPTALIISPAVSAENPGLCKLVGGTAVKVIGSVTDKGTHSTGESFDHFQGYTLEFGYGSAPASYTLIVSSSPGASRENAALGVWDTTGLPEGVYTLKLTAKDCVGNEAAATAQVIISQPKLLLSLGSRGNGKGEFNAPSYIAIDPADGSFWVSDTNNDRLQKFASSGTWLMEIASWDGEDKGKGKGHKADGFNKPQGIAVDSAGNLWATDGNNNRALKFSATGQFLLELKAGFNKPHGLALDAQDNLYVADRNNDRILKFSPEGQQLLEITTGLGADLNKPVGVLAVDRQGSLYISDRNNDRVLVYDPSGSFIRQLGEGSGSGPGQFNKPDGIVLNALAYVFVADTNNSRVQKFDHYGNLVMVFDRASNDAEESFNHPGGLALDAEGNLFVVDSNNARVKKFGAEGELVRIASQDDEEKTGARSAKLVAKAAGGKVHHPNGVTLDIPADALGSDAEIEITAGHKTGGAGYRTQGAGAGKKLASITENVEFGPDGTVFNKPVTISIPYNPARLAAGVSETELAVFWWNPARQVWEEMPSSVDTRLKVVTAQTTHFSLYTVMAPVVSGAEFALGEVYVYPNPAKRAEVPIFHIEAGMTDKVTIKIYTVSGRLAHETALTGLPQIIDDGRGSEYAYEYAWDGHIPSGVYYYFVEAEKAGKKLKKTGKFAVIR